MVSIWWTFLLSRITSDKPNVVSELNHLSNMLKSPSTISKDIVSELNCKKNNGWYAARSKMKWAISSSYCKDRLSLLTTCWIILENKSHSRFQAKDAKMLILIGLKFHRSNGLACATKDWTSHLLLSMPNRENRYMTDLLYLNFNQLGLWDMVK